MFYYQVIDLNNGLYHCEKCQQDFPQFNWRLILSVNLIDATGNVWATCFQDDGEKILGSSADELGHLQATDKTGFTEHIQVMEAKTTRAYFVGPSSICLPE